MFFCDEEHGNAGDNDKDGTCHQHPRPNVFIPRLSGIGLGHRCYSPIKVAFSFRTVRFGISVIGFTICEGKFNRLAAFFGVLREGGYLNRNGYGFAWRNFNTVFWQAGQGDIIKTFDCCSNSLFMFTLINDAQVVGIFQPAWLFHAPSRRVFQNIHFDHFTGRNAG